MALSSMTGFARGHGVCGPYAWAWEVKSVNGKGLDLRLRLPAGWDAVEAPVRAQAAEVLSRGTIYATLSVDRPGVVPGRARQHGGPRGGAGAPCGNLHRASMPRRRRSTACLRSRA